MVKKKMLLLLALITLPLFASGCGDKGPAAEKELTLGEIAALMQEKEDNVMDYSFTFSLKLDLEPIRKVDNGML